jgi:hypothetical protein
VAATLEDAFRGSNGIAGERLIALQDYEKEHANALAAFPWAHCSDGIVFDFALETFREASRHSGKGRLEFARHIASFWRFRTACNTFCQRASCGVPSSLHIARDSHFAITLAEPG